MQRGRRIISVIVFPLRAIVFLVGAFSFWMERAADWFVGARSQTEYVREGSCLRCGRCCHLLGLEVPSWLWRHPAILRCLEFWHDHVMNFEPAGKYEPARVLLYQCRYFRAEGVTKRCSIYRFRHRLCRFYPRQDLYGYPLLHEACGFRFVRREVVRRRCERESEGQVDFRQVLKRKIDSVAPTSDDGATRICESSPAPAIDSKGHASGATHGDA